MHSGVSHPPSRHFIGPSPYLVALPILNSISSTRTLPSPFTRHCTPLFLLSHHTIYSPSSHTHTHTSSPISPSHSLSSPPSPPTLSTTSTTRHSLLPSHTPPSSSTTHTHHHHTHNNSSRERGREQPPQPPHALLTARTIIPTIFRTNGGEMAKCEEMEGETGAGWHVHNSRDDWLNGVWLLAQFVASIHTFSS